ncbi:zinc-binding dehydrogenase [Phycicoccus endophyticus]|uniref:Zinc-binding dehydrogenase n=1 Tax=Phycicoccus endophyticus TaxID=1690220 RepID=A0A7G9R1Q6_9MICO|nr:zinc-binding dehydrogenase [Phycicoccus endophyticus]NHI18677.1 zinc-binding dehydrogenase [Phycicoccus endophyticus]QNN49531.1 zinc-binding dehydrogenase [Phycicoccus endophyticus]GGL37320.1 threonine dehydrogenase [Phycicoccus endophyticus]
MRSVRVTGPDRVEWVEVDPPVAGPRDVLLAMRACGICGSDAFYTHVGGIPPRQGATPLGHEPAAEVVEVGSQVTGLQVGDHVVVDTMRLRDGLLGSGGAQGALSEYVLVEDAAPGVQLRVIPEHIPWEVAALNEPMAVAHHAVRRSGAAEGDTAAVFGAGPIGLGAVLSLKSLGVGHVVVADVQPSRLEKALAVGADAVVRSDEEDVVARLRELHGEATDALGHAGKAGTDVYLDAAGVPAVVQDALRAAKHRAVLCIPAVHKEPVPVDFAQVLAAEVDIRLAMGYPSEIFEVTDAIIEHWERYARIISHTLPFERALEALTLAATPGAADKVVVTF